MLPPHCVGCLRARKKLELLTTPCRRQPDTAENLNKGVGRGFRGSRPRDALHIAADYPAAASAHLAHFFMEATPWPKRMGYDSEYVRACRASSCSMRHIPPYHRH